MPNNVLYNRHLLATRRQNEGESIDQYIQQLEKLSKHCEFKSVNSEVYIKEYIRDSFINGLKSNNIRRRLLENNNLTLDEMHQTARTLELAQKHSAAYSAGSAQYIGSTSAAASLSDNVREYERSDVDSSLAAAKDPIRGKKCSFCGRDYHPRDKCPAKNSRCNNCSKTGHWGQVCQQSQKSKQLSDTSCAIPFLA